MLFLVGETDALVVPEHRQAVAEALAHAGVRHEVVQYAGAGHGFFCERRAEFDAAEAQDAWRRIAALLERELSPLGAVAPDAVSAR